MSIFSEESGGSGRLERQTFSGTCVVTMSFYVNGSYTPIFSYTDPGTDRILFISYV